MNSLDKRKLNLLLHLAKIDGKFDRSERDLLKQFARERNLDEGLVDDDEEPMRISEFTSTDSKIELLYLALKLMMADDEIHFKEVLFCRNLAAKLGFREGVVDHYIDGQLPSFNAFEEQILDNWIIL